MADDVRARVRQAVEARGVRAVARDLGISPGGLLSFLVGTGHRAIEMMIMLRAHAVVATRKEPLA